MDHRLRVSLGCHRGPEALRVLLEREIGFNVFSYGTAGDGTVDDHAALQRAIDAACTASSVNGFGAVVKLPPYVYKCSRRLWVWADNVRIEGSVTKGARIQFDPDPAYDEVGFLFEEEGLNPLQHCGLSFLELRATADTSLVKVLVDVHGARQFTMHHVSTAGCTDTTNSSTSLRVRGWDNNLFYRLALTSDIPLRIGKNDDGVLGAIGSGYLDTTKDLDHTHFIRCNYVADNEDKIAVLFEDGVVHRNVTFDGAAMVHGGFYSVDVTEPRRRSTNLALKNVRFEGFAETDGSVVGKASVYFRRHANGKLRDLYMSNCLLAEGRDDRYGTTGANWNGIDTEGVINKVLNSVTYDGEATPVSCDGSSPVITGGNYRLVHTDNGIAKPCTEAQWDILAVARPRSWWKYSTASGNQTDQQDAAVSGLADRNLAVNGSPTYQQFVDGWHDYHILYTEAADQRFGLNSGLTDFNPQDRSAAWYMSIKFPSGWTPGGDRILINLGTCAQTAGNGPNVYITSDGTLDIFAGDTVVSGTRDYRGQDVGILASYNRTASSWIVWVAQWGSTTIETITGTYDATVGSSNQKGFGAESGSFTNSAGAQDFGAMWFNSDAESLSADTLRAMGWGI